MPQKRNPVALEHARAILSRAVGHAAAVTSVVHNTPFGDIVDSEDDLQPLVCRTFRDGMRAVTLLAAVVREVELNVSRLESRAGECWTTLTELADSLTREKGVPFRTAHEVARRVGEIRRAHPSLPLSRCLVQASDGLMDPPPDYTDAEIAERLDARYFVAIRETLGGPSLSETTRGLARGRELLGEDEAWWARATSALSAAGRRLATRSAAL
jgi:argininosuccinate lyase